jgi:hypothetical protein
MSKPKFARHKTPEEIRKACQVARFTYDRGPFDAGSDYITFLFRHKGVTCFAYYSAVNGRCFGKLQGVPKESWFSTDDSKFNNRPWFKALLAFIYIK